MAISPKKRVFVIENVTNSDSYSQKIVARLDAIARVDYTTWPNDPDLGVSAFVVFKDNRALPCDKATADEITYALVAENKA